MLKLSHRTLFMSSVLVAAVVAFTTNRAHASPLVGPGLDSLDREVGSITETISGVDYDLNYELFRPPGYATAGSQPLVVYLHGYGDGRDIKQARLNDTMHDLVHATQHENDDRGVDASLVAQFDQDFSSYLLVPKIPVQESWFSRLTMAKQLIDSAFTNYDIDTNRVYLSGFSNGGFAMPYMIEQYPGLFAAGVSFAGGGSPDADQVAALKDVPLWFFHDIQDPTVDYTRSETMVDALIAGGGSPNLTLYDGATSYAHDSWYLALQDPSNTFYPWLFSQPVPDIVEPPPIPEPSSSVLFLAGIGSLILVRWKRRRNKNRSYPI